MIVDIFTLIDDAPLILKRPLLPYSFSSFRIPIYVIYDPQASNWPEYPYYNTDDLLITAVLIGGRRFPYTANNIPETGFYTIHVEEDASYIVIGFNYETLWMYERIEVILTSGQVYSYYGSRDPDGDPNPPMIISVPEIKKRADALKVSKFSFETIKLGFIKEKQSIFLYGGEIVLSLRHRETNAGETRDFPLGRYIINKITHDTSNATIEGIDFRYLLNSKFPTEIFNKDDYPYIQDEHIDTIKPVMLGIGNGIPGIPTNGMQIYSNYPTKIVYYDFQFPAGWIGNPYKIEVKQGDTWTEVYPGLGNPFFTDIYNNNLPQNRQILINGIYYTPIEFNSDTGVVKLIYLQALEDGEYGNNPNEIRMYAKWTNATMNEAMRFLLTASGNTSLLSGFSGEFTGLAEIGIYLDKAEPIFTWVEKLQAANILNGQLMLINDALNFRLENPNRVFKLEVPSTDVKNHENLSVAIAEDFMYSGWEIVWKKAWTNDDEGDGKSIGVNYRYPIATIYKNTDLTVKYERQSPTQQIFNTSTLQQRINIIKDLISTFRHRIIGLELPLYFDYLELIIYDVIRYMPKALENSGRPYYEWIIYDKKINLEKETIALTLVERIISNNWNNGNP